MSARTASHATAPLAIICGGGTIPLAVAESVARGGRPFMLFPLRGWADRAVERYPHHWIALGQFGHFLRAATAEGCRDVVFIGTLMRPRISNLRLDWATMRLLPRIVRGFRGGDDYLLSCVASIFEEHGFRIVGAHEVAPDILVPAGSLGRHAPSESDLADIARGLQLLKAIGSFDVGQAAVVVDRHIVGIEAAEGTDGLLARVAALREAGRIPAPSGTGVLVKAPKPQQDRRLDLPAIGPQTIEAVVRAGLAGIAVVANETIMAEPQEIVRRADRNGVFVVGVHDPEPPA
jgi:DUF1009 family protein